MMPKQKSNADKSVVTTTSKAISSGPYDTEEEAQQAAALCEIWHAAYRSSWDDKWWLTLGQRTIMPPGMENQW